MKIEPDTGRDEPHSILISGISVDAFHSPAKLAEHVIRSDGSLMPGSAIAINPEKIMRSRKDPELLNILHEATIRFADGAGVVWAMRRKGVTGNRVPGVEVWEQLMRRSAENNVAVFLLGASQEVLDATCEKLRIEMPGIRIEEALHGYASDDELESFKQSLSSCQSAVVAVALGSPRQEKMIKNLQAHSSRAFFMGVGGTFDCYVGNVQRAPQAWQNANLEWLYRLIRQPSRITRQWILVPYVFLTLFGRI